MAAHRTLPAQMPDAHVANEQVQLLGGRAFVEIVAQLGGLLAVIATEIARLNRLAQERGIPAIMVQERDWKTSLTFIADLMT